MEIACICDRAQIRLARSAVGLDCRGRGDLEGHLRKEGHLWKEGADVQRVGYLVKNIVVRK